MDESTRSFILKNFPQQKSANDHGSESAALPFRLPSEILAAGKPWIVKGLIARGDTSSWIGPPGATKSALLTDLAVHIAARPSWRGKTVKANCGVVYFALERGGLVERRLLGYQQRGDLPDTAPIAVVSRIIDLLSESCIQIVLDTLAAVEDRTQAEVGFVVFDTYNKAIAAGGGDEDKARDQNRVSANLRRIIERKPVHIAGIGHTGKDENRGERGSNARLADVDLCVTIAASDAVRTATVTKANDLEEGPLVSYAMERIVLGVDDDGEDIAIHVLDATQMATRKSRTGRPPRSAQTVLRLLAEAIAENPDPTPASPRIPQGVRTKVLSVFMSENSRGIVAEDKKDESAQRAMRRAIRTLQDTGFIGVWDDTVWLTER